MAGTAGREMQQMGWSCLYDLLRLVQLLLGLLCIALWITAALLGADAHAVLTIPESSWSEFNINIWGPRRTSPS